MEGAEGTDDLPCQGTQAYKLKTIQSGSLLLSSHRLSGSAVSALKSKVKERSQISCPLVGSFKPLQHKSDQVQEWRRRTRTNAEELSQAQVVTETDVESGVLENITTGWDQSLQTKISLRTWKPPKGFWREILIQPDSLLINKDIQEQSRSEETVCVEMQKPKCKPHRDERRKKSEERPETWEKPEESEGQGTEHYWGGNKTEIEGMQKSKNLKPNHAGKELP